MTFTEPQPLTDLIDKLDAKTPIGSAMRTAEWERVPQGLRDGAFFSAGVTHTQFLAQQQRSITDMIARARETNAAGESMWKMGRGQFIKQLRQMGEALGVQHPEGREGGIKERDITDPLSIARLNLVVNTQLELAYGYGQYVAAMDEDVLQEWPAWELVRITPRAAPRDWAKRWSEAGGTLHDGRMIALKTSPIWVNLSRFGNPHPPFDFNSGMGVEEVDRDTAESLGLMSMSMEEALQDFATLKYQTAAQLKAGRGKFNLAPESQQPGLKAFQEGLEASVKDVPPAMRQKLKGIFKSKINIDGDTVQWAQDAPEKRRDDALEGTPPRADGSMPALKDKVVRRPKSGKSLAAEPHLPTPEESDIINLQDERGWAYDESGKVVGFVDGRGSKIKDIPEKLRRPGYTFTHNHPEGGSFTSQDIHMAAANELRELRAIGHQGSGRRYLYRVSFDPSMSRDERLQAVNLYERMVKEVIKETLGARSDGRMTNAEYHREREHLVMQRVSAELQGRLIYDRILLP